MKLSEAIMLGDCLRKRNSGLTLRVRNGVCEGCAIGGAILAAGGKERYDFEKIWPWAEKERAWSAISDLFFRVMRDEQTFESLVDYVRSVEPKCGECNRFECTCAKTGPAVEQACTQEESR